MPEALEPLEKVRRAIGFALRKHEGQMRKDGKTPYIAHPLRVFARLAVELEVKDEDILVAGILHDTIEDTLTDFDDVEEKFGERVARFVAAMTHDKRAPEKERDRTFWASLEKAPWEVRLVKLCDMLDNVLDSPELPEEKRRTYVTKKREEFPMLSHGMPDRFQGLVKKVAAKLGLA